jgi:methylamine dehydrogenase light chain
MALPPAPPADWPKRPRSRRAWLKGLVAALLTTWTLLRDEQDLAAQASCSQWHRRGMCGCLCSCLGGSDSACPSGTQEGGAWWACCFSSGRLWLVRYLDCCGPRDRRPACPSGCSCNQNNSCGQYPSNQNWCPNPSTRAAYCTRAQVWSQC